MHFGRHVFIVDAYVSQYSFSIQYSLQIGFYCIATFLLVPTNTRWEITDCTNQVGKLETTFIKNSYLPID